MNKRNMALIALMSMVPIDEAEELLSRNFSFEQENVYDEGYPLYPEGFGYRRATGPCLHPAWDDSDSRIYGLV